VRDVEDLEAVVEHLPVNGNGMRRRFDENSSFDMPATRRVPSNVREVGDFVEVAPVAARPGLATAELELLPSGGSAAGSPSLVVLRRRVRCRHLRELDVSSGTSASVPSRCRP